MSISRTFLSINSQSGRNSKKYFLYDVHHSLGLINSENDVSYISTEKALYQNVENTIFRHIQPDCWPLKKKSKKQLVFTKIQTIFRILTKSQNFPILALGSLFLWKKLRDSWLTEVSQMVGESGSKLSNGIARSKIDLPNVCSKKCPVCICLTVRSLWNPKNHYHHPLIKLN